METQKSGIKTTINIPKGSSDDSKQLTRDVASIGHLGNSDYAIKATDTKYLEYIMSLIKQAIK